MTRGVEPVVLNLVDEMEHAFSPMLATPGMPVFFHASIFCLLRLVRMEDVPRSRDIYQGYGAVYQQDLRWRPSMLVRFL